MHLSHIPRRGLTAGAATLALLALAACADDPQLVVPEQKTATAGALFDRYVAIGNSITAGFQSDGINDSTQQESYARLLAQQFGTTYRYASLAMPGCQPPIRDALTGARVGTTATVNTAGTCSLLAQPAGGPLNNVAIPGAASEDPTSRSTIASNTITTLILGGKTQVEKSLETNPTFYTIWIGNNDILQAAGTGITVPLAGVSRGITDTTVFKVNYRTMIKAITDSAPGAKGALIGVANTAVIPLLFPVAVLLQSPAARGAFVQATGGDPANPASLTILPNCGTAAAPANYLVSFAIAARIAAYRANPSTPGAHPPLISCGVTAAAPAPVGNIFLLDPTEQAALATALNTYNAYIKSQADSIGWAYVDPNPTLIAAKTADVANTTDPRITSFPNLGLALQGKSPFGSWFSLDGVHPSLDAHQQIANVIIQAINAKFATTVPLCNTITRATSGVHAPSCS